MPLTVIRRHIIESRQTEIFRALKSTVRRSILLELRDRDLTPGYFSLVYELAPSTITKHLNILEQAGLIKRYKQGRERYCHTDIWLLSKVKVDWLAKLLL